MSAADLQHYVRAADGDLDFVTDCYDEATALVDKHVAGVPDGDVPDVVLSRAVLEVGAELFHRRATKNGVAQFATGDGQPVRVARDPMVAARPILAPYVALGIS